MSDRCPGLEAGWIRKPLPMPPMLLIRYHRRWRQAPGCQTECKCMRERYQLRLKRGTDCLTKSIIVGLRRDAPGCKARKRPTSSFKHEDTQAPSSFGGTSGLCRVIKDPSTYSCMACTSMPVALGRVERYPLTWLSSEPSCSTASRARNWKWPYTASNMSAETPKRSCRASTPGSGSGSAECRRTCRLG